MSSMNNDDDLSDAFLRAFDTPIPAQSYTNGAKVSSPESIPQSPTTITHPSKSPSLNPRSCVTCRKRKVRCDKHEPCSNCVKASIPCHFPPPGRAPRKPKRSQDVELLKRLRRLESVVENLGSHVDEHGNVHALEKVTSPALSPTSDRRASTDTTKTLEHSLGRLLIKEGRSRYVSNEFWASLGDELAELRNVLDSASSDEDEEHPTHSHSPSDFNHQSFVLGYSSLMLDMTKLQPTPTQIFIMWETFKENVDPLMKIVHVPTVKNIIMKAASATALTRPTEVLFYSICFAAVVSMSNDQCQSLLGSSKTELMRKYRFATEQGLARANFLNNSSLVVLQAFVLFLTCVKFMDTTRSIWALSGLAMQQAQAQGLHRDGSHFNLPPFEIEMRRRLWHLLYLQLSRAVEDHGADPQYNDHDSDTKLPLNLNDEDMWPEMTHEPVERIGATDMTFCLVRIELGHFARKLRIWVTSGAREEDKHRTVKDRERLIDVTHQHMQEKFFQYCDQNDPFLWVASTVGKLILAKMWLFVHHPNLTTTDPATKDQVFITSIEVVEFGILLERGKDTAKWSWLFRTYMQWHAFAYVLSELATRAPGPEYDRAWNVVDAVHERTMLEKSAGKKEVIWKPLKTLWLKAKERREVVTGRKVSPVNLDIDIPTDDWNNSLMESIGKSGHGSGGLGRGSGGLVNGTGGMAPQIIDFNDPGFGLQTMFDGENGFMPQMQQGLLWAPGLDDIVGTMQPWTGGQEEWH